MPTPAPQLVLDEDGYITSGNEAARGVLGCASEGLSDINFFAQVHGRNLPRVMRDLARMVQTDVRRARWLLRLRTGDPRWRWFRVKVFNRLSTEEGVQLRLHPVGQGRPYA